jgi:hypothetical protein
LTPPASRQRLEARKGRYRLPDEPARFGKQYLLGTFPVGNLSAAAPVGGGLPFRVTVSARSEFKQFFNECDANIDRLTFSGRIQYVDPTNDQVWSPYFGITPPLSYLSTFSDGKEVRQDFNLGVQKSRLRQFVPAHSRRRRHLRRNRLVVGTHRVWAKPSIVSRSSRPRLWS